VTRNYLRISNIGLRSAFPTPIQVQVGHTHSCELHTPTHLLFKGHQMGKRVPSLNIFIEAAMKIITQRFRTPKNNIKKTCKRVDGIKPHNTHDKECHVSRQMLSPSGHTLMIIPYPTLTGGSHKGGRTIMWRTRRFQDRGSIKGLYNPTAFSPACTPSYVIFNRMVVTYIWQQLKSKILAPSYSLCVSPSFGITRKVMLYDQT
jgi:hypothetical protein